MNLRQSLLIMGASALFACGAHALPPLSDDSSGMTCRHFVVGAKLAWLSKGGDWIDAKGTPNGTAAYASQSAASTTAGGRLAFDVTSLVRSWNDGAEPSGAIFLRAVSGARSGRIEVHSRESPDAEAHPKLHIDWSDGTRTSLEASADTHLNCSTHSSRGGEPFVRIGAGVNGIVVFPFKRNGARSVGKAELVVTATDRVAPVSIGVFRPFPPWASESAPAAGLAAKFPRDHNIGASAAVLFATGFESADWKEEWSSNGRGEHAETVTSREQNGFRPLDGKALKVTVKERHNLGLNTHFRFGGDEPDEVYFRYYVRFGDDWRPIKDGGKLPGLSGTYGKGGWGSRRSNGTNGWSARGSFARQPASSRIADLVGLGSYVYQADMKGDFGEHWGWNLGPSGMLEKNRWYSIEQHVKLNDPERADGILRAWVDGRLVLQKTDVRFRTSADLHVESVWMNVYHGGTSPSPRDMSLYIDNVVVAREYIGPRVD